MWTPFEGWAATTFNALGRPFLACDSSAKCAISGTPAGPGGLMPRSPRGLSVTWIGWCSLCVPPAKVGVCAVVNELGAYRIVTCGIVA